jgi:CPA2 family monovalent cation:H+ antiporter-2
MVVVMMGFLASATHVEPIFVLLGLVLASAVVVSLVFARFKQSLILGYFFCGIVLGNSQLLMRLGIGETETLIATLAESGVILLMFTLGIEFSLTELKKLRRVALVGGGVQLAATFLVAAAVFGWAAGEAWGTAGLLGFMVALSSTALALKLFQDSGQATGPGARLALGVALFQDIAVIGFMLVMPVLYGREGGGLAGPLAGALARGVVFLGFALLATRFIVPRLLGSVTATRSRELFTLTVVALCAGIASAGWGLGLSLALGAFVAGLVVSESVYSHRILADVLPFKDLFLALFFISVGLMIDLSVFAERWWFFLAVASGLFAGKVLLAFLAGRAVGYPVRACVQAALALGSIGEFSLVLVSKAMGLGVFDTERQQFFLIVTALSMAMAPVAMRFCGPISRRLESWPVFKHHVRAEKGTAHSIIPTLDGHAIICGYGPVGRRLDEALRRAGIATVVIELNVGTVKELKTAGQPVLFADAAQSETLPLAGIGRAGLLAITFPQYEAARAITAHARTLNSDIPIFCRVKFDREVEGLRAAGVECIVQDELESAIGLVHKALGHFNRSDEEIRNEEDMIRYRGGVDG